MKGKVYIAPQNIVKALNCLPFAIMTGHSKLEGDTPKVHASL